MSSCHLPGRCRSFSRIDMADEAVSCRHWTPTNGSMSQRLETSHEIVARACPHLDQDFRASPAGSMPSGAWRHPSLPPAIPSLSSARQPSSKSCWKCWIRQVLKSRKPPPPPPFSATDEIVCVCPLVAYGDGVCCSASRSSVDVLSLLMTASSSSPTFLVPMCFRLVTWPLEVPRALSRSRKVSECNHAFRRLPMTISRDVNCSCRTHRHLTMHDAK